MMANSRWKLYALIGRNIGKSLSGVLRVDYIIFNDLKLTYENIVIRNEDDFVVVHSLETTFNILRYSNLTKKFYYRGISMWWTEFDIDSILNKSFEDIV